MQPLDPAAYERVLPLVPDSTQAGHMAFVHQLLAGRCPGNVLVDSPTAPTSALVCPDSGFFLALGAPQRDAVASFLPDLVERFVAPEPTVLLSTTAAWQAALDPLLGAHIERREFHYRPAGAAPAAGTAGPTLAVGTAGPTRAPGLQTAPMAPLPSGLRLERLDARLAANFDRGGVDPWVIRIWGGPARFAAECFGWAVVDGDTVASFCTACAIGGPACAVEAEIEVGTAPVYQRRGFARVAAHAFLEECAQRGLRPAWTCAADNEPSRRLAERLGFSEFRRVRGYPLDRRMQCVDGRWWMPRSGVSG